MKALLPSLSRSQTPESVYTNRFIIMLTVTLASVLELLDTSIVNVAIPHMMGTLGATLDEIAWVSTGYVVANVIVLPISGWLANQLGRRNYFALSIGIFTVASVACGGASSQESLVFWRIVQGLGGGGLLATSQAAIFEIFPPKEAGQAITFFGVGIMVGPALGPTLGGYLTDAYSWPWIFYINLPLGLLALVLALLYVPDSALQRKAEKIDYVGLLLLTIGIGTLQTLLERGERYDWFESEQILLLAIASALALGLFVIHELETDCPVVDLRIMRDSQFSSGLIYVAFTGAVLFCTIFIFPVYTQVLMGYDALQAGLFVLPTALATAVAMSVTALLITWGLPARGIVLLGTLLFVYAMWQHSLFTTESSASDFFWPLVLRGFGLGMLTMPLNYLAMCNLKPQDIPNASGLYNVTRMLGGSIGIAVSATLFGHINRTQHAYLTEHLSGNDLLTLQRIDQYKQYLYSRGFTEPLTQLKAYALLELNVQQQAMMLTFSKLFLAFGALLACALPLLLLIREHKYPHGSLDQNQVHH